MRSIIIGAAIFVIAFVNPSRVLGQNSVIDAYERGVQARQAQERIDLENKQKAEALAQQKAQFDRELAQKQKEMEQQQNQKILAPIDTDPNFSYYGTANELMKDCNAGIAIVERRLAADDKAIIQGIASANRCSGYVSAIVDINESIGSKLFCAPKQASVEQFTRIFLKYMADDPQDLHRSPVSMLLAALGKTFPCAEHK